MHGNFSRYSSSFRVLMGVLTLSCIKQDMYNNQHSIEVRMRSFYIYGYIMNKCILFLGAMYGNRHPDVTEPHTVNKNKAKAT